MIAALILYGCLVGTCVGLAAHAADAVARLLRLPSRWVWIGALLVIAALVGTAPFRAVFRSAEPRPIAAIGPGGMAETAPPAIPFLTAATRRVPATAKDVLMIGWALASGGLFFLVIGVYFRAWRLRRAWPLVEIGGLPVRVAPSAGPAVMGLLRPEVVVPSWLLARPSAEQGIVVAHEAQHVRARDQLLLTAGWLFVVAMPWNVAVWWIVSRLRLAVELDCDARVLQAGTPAADYGHLLIDVAARHAGVRIGAPALLESPTHLQRRLTAMNQQTQRFASLRGAAALLIATAAMVVACRTEVPTSADIAKMDAKGAERLARAVDPGDSIIFKVNGVVVPAESARIIPASQILAVRTDRGSDGLSGGRGRARGGGGAGPSSDQIPAGTTTVGIFTVGGTGVELEGKLVASAETVRTVIPGKDGQPNMTHQSVTQTQTFEFPGLIFLDGKRVDSKLLAALDRANIVSVEILKGPAAVQQFNDPAAVNGVILILTRK